MKRIIRRALAFELVCLAFAVLSARAQNTPTDLTSMKLEDLMNIDVTSASKKEQKVSQVPAAIFVITRRDIERSGAINVADLLRMVPGLDVAQISPSAWAISARGFNGQYSNKLLVLIDGLRAYTPIFSGVYWDSLDFALDSIERIEIIRGPGAAVWGSDAMNGVINIITEKAEDDGFAVSAHGGSIAHGGGSVRYGGKAGGHGTYRLFADGFEMGPYLTIAKQNGQDDWHGFHGGFRLDTEVSPKDALTVESQGFVANEGEWASTILSIAPPLNGIIHLRRSYSGWNFLGRWTHTASTNSETSLQVYFDRSDVGDSTYPTGLDRYDVDFQHHVRWRKRNDFVWGLGYRLDSDDTTGTLRISFLPTALNSQTFSSFLQDEISILPGRLNVILGAKLEHEYYNGLNFQPSARITWNPSDRETFWAAISGAQRTPSRLETSARYDYAAYPGANNIPILTSVFGNPDQLNERLIAHEAGYRRGLSDRVSFDSSFFFNQYHDLRTSEPGVPRLEADPAPLHLLIPFTFANLAHGETHGIEIFGNVKLANQWTLSPGYSILGMHLHRDASSLDATTVPTTEGGAPSHQAQLRSTVNLPWHLQSTTSAYFVDRLKAQSVPSYTRLDTNLAWQASEKVSLGVVGQNLLESLHQEYNGPDLAIEPSLIRRSGYVWLTWRF